MLTPRATWPMENTDSATSVPPSFTFISAPDFNLRTSQAR